MTDIIVEDGTVVSGSNSYTTVSGITTYAEDYGITDWTDSSVTEEIRKQALFKSMRYLESLPWKGTKSTQEQNLEFPRVELYDRNGYLIDETTIPPAVIDAECVIAACMLPNSEVNLQPTFTKDDYLIETSVYGAVTEKWDEDGSTRRPNNTTIKDLLKGLIGSSCIITVERS